MSENSAFARGNCRDAEMGDAAKDESEEADANEPTEQDLEAGREQFRR